MDRVESCTGLVQAIFAKSDSLFSQLAYLAQARDPQTGRYADTTLSLAFESEEIDRTLRLEHRKVFAAWLNLSLRDQGLELRRYLDKAHDPGVVLTDWMQHRCYERLIPAGASQPERQLLTKDLEMVAALIYARLAHEVPSSERERTHRPYQNAVEESA